jgi:hypothetical protein
MLPSCKNTNHSQFPTCVKLTKTQIKEWIKKGYTDPINPDFIKSVRFKTAYAFQGSVFRVFVIGLRKDGSIVDESLTELIPIDTCNREHIKLSPFIFTGTNPADLADLEIVKKNGQLIDSLEYLKLEPYNYTDTASRFDLLAYRVSTITERGYEIQNAKSGKVGLPCPPCPNCNQTSCPASCNGVCGSQ